MSNAFERMKALLGDYVEFSEHGISTGEIYAYSKGIEYVFELFETAENLLCLAGEKDIEYYCNLLKLNASLYDEEELLSRITSRLSKGFASYSLSEICAAFYEIGSGELEISGNAFVITSAEPEYLGEIGKFLLAYMPFSMTSGAGGSGMSFDDWDAFAQTFGTYDSFLLPFSFIDTLRSEDIEQH